MGSLSAQTTASRLPRSAYKNANPQETNSEKPLILNSLRGNVGRGFVSYGGPKYMQFDPQHILENTTISTSLHFYSGGYLDGILYAYETVVDTNNVAHDCTYLIINSQTGEIVNTIPQPDLYGIIIGSVCYDYSTNTMYALKAGIPNVLIPINIETGKQEGWIMINGTADLLLTMAIDLDGNIFAIEANSTGSGRLYKINKLFGSATPVGYTGFPVNYAQSMAFDYNDPACPLYWAQLAQPSEGNIISNWTKVNKNTGAATVVTPNIDMEITGLHFAFVPDPCDTVTNLVVKYNGNCSKATLTWNAPATADVKYNVFRDSELIAESIKETTFEDITFDKTKSYTWRVVVICSGGNESEPVSKTLAACYTPGLPDCEPVPNVDAKYSAKDKNVTVKWSAPLVEVAPKSYEIYRDKVKLCDTTVTEYIDDVSKLAEGEYVYKYCVLPIYEIGDCNGEVREECDEVSFTVKEIKNYTTHFSIFPNPANNVVAITAANNFNTIEILSFLGQVVVSQPNTGNSAKLDISTLTNGIYFIRLTSETGTSVKKFVKQ